MTEATASGASAPTAIAQNSDSRRTYEPSKDAPAKADPVANPFKGTKHRTRIDGEDLEVDYDELVRGYQKAQVSDRRLREAQALQAKAKTAQDIESHLEKGDISWLTKKLGAEKAKDLFENFLIEQMEYDQLPQSEKRARALEAENKELKSAQEKEREDAQKQQHDAIVHRAYEDLDTEISEALKASGITKPTPRLALRIIDEIEARLNSKGRKIPAGEAKDAAIKSIHQDIAEYLPLIPIADLRKLLPKQVLDALRRDDVEQVLGEKQARRIRLTGEQAPAAKQTKPVTVSNWFDKMEQKLQKKRS